jgi:hypothetical protein
LPSSPSTPLTPAEAYTALRDVRPPDAVLVNESTSTMVAIVAGFGCRSAHANTAGDIRDQFKLATGAGGPTVIVVGTQPQYAELG